MLFVFYEILLLLCLLFKLLPRMEWKSHIRRCVTEKKSATIHARSLKKTRNLLTRTVFQCYYSLTKRKLTFGTLLQLLTKIQNGHSNELICSQIRPRPNFGTVLLSGLPLALNLFINAYKRIKRDEAQIKLEAYTVFMSRERKASSSRNFITRSVPIHHEKPVGWRCT